MLESQCLFDKTFSSSVFRMGREGGEGGGCLFACVLLMCRSKSKAMKPANVLLLLLLWVFFFFYYEVIPRSLESHLRFKVVILSWLEVG